MIENDAQRPSRRPVTNYSLEYHLSLPALVPKGGCEKGTSDDTERLRAARSTTKRPTDAVDSSRRRVAAYAKRRRVGENDGFFADREIDYEVVELTSRVSTADIAVARRRLAASFSQAGERIDVALATNMISVGIDIARLGLMVVF